jgi:hypothetical protein
MGVTGEKDYDFIMEFLYSKEKNKRITKMIFIPLFVLVLLAYCIVFIPDTKCIMEPFITHVVSACGPKFHIFRLVINFIEYVALVYFFIMINFRFQIKNDKFYIRSELSILSIIWLVSNNVYIGLQYFVDYLLSEIFYMSFNLMIDFSTVLLYVVLTIKRSRLKKEMFYINFENFEIFTNNPMGYAYFRKKLMQTKLEDYRYFTFYNDYQLYKCLTDRMEVPRVNQASTRDITIADDQNRLHEDAVKIAFEMYINHFEDKDSFSQLRKIPFPNDIRYTIENAYEKEFKIRTVKLKTLFDNANNFVLNRLEAIFQEFREEEEEQIKNLIQIVDFY